MSVAAVSFYVHQSQMKLNFLHNIIQIVFFSLQIIIIQTASVLNINFYFGSWWFEINWLNVDLFIIWTFKGEVHGCLYVSKSITFNVFLSSGDFDEVPDKCRWFWFWFWFEEVSDKFVFVFCGDFDELPDKCRWRVWFSAHLSQSPWLWTEGAQHPAMFFIAIFQC